MAGLVELARVQDTVGNRKIDEILFTATGEGGATFVLFKFLDRAAPAQEELILGFQTDGIVTFVERTKAGGGTVVEPVEVRKLMASR